MDKKYRYILFGLSGIALLIIGLFFEKSLINLFNMFWFSSGLLLLILLSLVDQPFFSKDSNIFVNAITAGVSLLLVSAENRDVVYYFFVAYIFYLLISSYVLMWIRKKTLNEENMVVQALSRINRILGKPNTIFSLFFLWGAFSQYNIKTNKFNTLFCFWVAFMLFNIPEIAKIIEQIFSVRNIKVEDNIGEIMGVQSKNTFLVKLNENRKKVELYDFVEFNYSVDDKVKRGLVSDIFLLEQEKWIQVIINSEINQMLVKEPQLSKYESDYVYKMHGVSSDEYLNKFVGIVTKDSNINIIKFLYNSNIIIYEGHIIEAHFNDLVVLYQIIEARTQVEQLQNKNQSGFIVSEAIQLGIWNSNKNQFDKYGWVPQINTPLYIAKDIDDLTVEKSEIIIGKLPNTNFPIVMDKYLAITYHMAIIGVTGTGKSVFSRNIIREFLKEDNIKIICIDFTGEYAIKFSDIKPIKIIDDATAKEMFSWINEIESIMSAHYNKDTDESKAMKIKIYTSMQKKINEFLKCDTSNLALLELPEVDNTSGVMKYMQTFFKALFKIAKVEKNYGKIVSLVLEEAHTIIPESRFSGIDEKVSQPLINSIAQIALQGRKYNIGLLVIAQRTANVSKTILTQCNTIISFQEFDKTSEEFLANYFGNDFAASLKKLRFRQAIAAGKAFKSNVPLIFDVPEILESEIEVKKEENLVI